MNNTIVALMRSRYVSCKWNIVFYKQISPHYSLLNYHQFQHYLEVSGRSSAKLQLYSQKEFDEFFVNSKVDFLGFLSLI